jgi:glutathione S-transferase
VKNSSLTLYGFRLSGHSHRAELGLSLLGLCYERIEVDLRRGEHKTPEFLRRNPFGQVPVLVDGGRVVADSNAILVYLASVYDPERRWYPADPLRGSAVQRWLSVAAGPLLTGAAHARLVALFNAKHDLVRAQATARQLFDVMEWHLRAEGGHLVGAQPTIADVALYTYTALAPEGHISLDPYPGIRTWLQAIESLPGFLPMARTKPSFGSPASASQQA